MCQTDTRNLKNINVSNNTIINTNAPLFFNEDKGSNDPTGIVSNNLIYFAENDPNISVVISGNSGIAYNNLGTALTYSGNVFNGTELGVTNTGFTKETGITVTSNDEIFTISGNGSEGKGADMGAYTPATDDMVGYGILNYLGTNITDGVCTIVVGEYITVSSLPTLTSVVGSYDVSVNANVSWTAVSNDAWISIDTNSGASGSVTVSITVTKNDVVSSRAGTVTFTQDAGGDAIVRTLNITQEGLELTDLYNLINTGTGLDTDKVTIDYFSKEEVNGSTKFNYAKNTLDKDNSTVWAADDGAILVGDFKGDGEYIIYDLGDIYDLDLIQFSTTNKSDPFGYQILVSETETNSENFSMILPDSGELILTAKSTTDFNQYEVNTTAHYIKLIGYGRFNSDGDTRKSAWNAVGEIEFYGDLYLQSGDDNDGDGVLDTNNNCPDTPNPNQEDIDGDGIGDTCDDDIDGDTILNDVDICSSTPIGVSGDANGCILLAADNFEIKTISETCPNKNNGQLKISAKESRDYKLTINGDTQSFTSNVTVDNLSPGAYEICIEVVGITSPYFYVVEIEAGTTISGKSSLSNKQLQVEVTEGTLPFKVFVNGNLQFETNRNYFSLEVAHGDSIQVKTAFECEGVYAKKIKLYDDLTVYPNPSEGLFTIAIPSNTKEVTIKVFNNISQMVLSKTYEVINSRVQLDLTNRPVGVYILKVYLDKEYVIKAVKQ